MATSSEASVPRYVGAAFVAQFVTSLAAGLLSTPALSGGVGNVLAAGADATRLRAVVLLELLTGVGIIALTSLLYVALRDTVRWVATVAFALWLAEATVLAASMLGLYALLDLGGTSVGSGSAVSASDTVVGKFAIGLHEHAADIGMLFCGCAALVLPVRSHAVRPAVARHLGSRVGRTGLSRNPALRVGQGPASADPALRRLRALRALRRDLARQGIRSSMIARVWAGLISAPLTVMCPDPRAGSAQ